MCRWIRRRRKGDSRSGREAQAALERAEHDLQEIAGRGPEVTRAVAKLREIRRQNHFAERFEQVFGGGGR
jgi:hypothetical protein